MAVDYLSALNTKGSGLNITQIVDSLVDADVMPKKDALEKQITEKNTQISALAEVVSDLNSLKADMTSLANTTQLTASSGSTGLTIAVSDSAVAQQFAADVTISSLATAQTIEFDDFTSPVAAIGTGAITVEIGTWASPYGAASGNFTSSSTSSFTVSGSPTLTSLAAQFDAIAGVNASVLDVGDGTYSLVIKSELGASNAINIDVTTSNGVSGGTTALSSFDTDASGVASVQKVVATDATMTVDGITVKRSTNTITDLFDGYSVNLVNSPVSTAFRVKASTDVDSAYTAMNSLVSSINVTKSLFNTLTDRENEGALADDPVVASIERKLDSYFNGGITGFFTSNLYMSELGVSTNRDGSISLNETTFRNAMAVEGTTSIAGGSKLFNAVFNSSVYSDNPLLSVEKSSYVDPVAGVYAFAQSTGNPPTATLEGSASGISTYDAASAPFYTSTATNTKGLKITPSTTDNISGANIFVGTSLLDQISTYIDTVLASSGDLATRNSNLGSQLSDAEIELADVESRTEGIRERYMSQFSAMESAVTSLKGTGDYLTNMIESWNSDK
ncbi:MAG: flagellar filament capping protein FliD [Pseudomonadota bacterium]|nr:flagellar filament capping protein FliD [Pseudomonadota bacterium]